MTADNLPTVSSTNSNSSTDSLSTKQRKKRRWDEPAVPLVISGIALPGSLPLVNDGSPFGFAVPGVVPVTGASVATPLTTNGAALLPGFQVHLHQQAAVALAQKVIPPKIQDEVIAREIVINDADSAIRYKLTKRQTQEEIQKCTGAVVITRGKYRPPNAPPDGEKPLYLHISAGSHLETTVERIKAVDRAAAMVEEILKPSSLNTGVKDNHLLNTCVYLGFEADPTLDIAIRIRGPNDQYINHIMNETGATVLLRGQGSGSESALAEEGLQPLHLFLSSNNPKSLEQAKLLAENLLDTICAECGASRVSSCKVYGAVPPPPQLLTGLESSVVESKACNGILASSSVSSMGFMPAVSSVSAFGPAGVVPTGMVSQSVGSPNVQSQTTTSCYPHSSLSGGTSYNGYGGLYPQATPLQQVALALRQTASPVSSTIAPVITAAYATSHTTAGSCDDVERRPQRRKFQESPAAAKWATSSQQNSLQGSNLQKPYELTSDVGSQDVSMMPPPKNTNKPSSKEIVSLPSKNLVRPSSDGMPPPPPPPPPKVMPPPPPKFNSPSPKAHEDNNIQLKSESVSDTLVKLMEYGDDDDDELEEYNDMSNSSTRVAPKPFWAV